MIKLTQQGNCTVRELQHAYALIKNGEENWTRGAFARDHNGNSVEANNQNAVCFCSMGAIQKAAESDLFSYYQASVEYLLIALCLIKGLECQELWDLDIFNDISSYLEVKEMFEIAIAFAKGELE